MTMMSVTRAGGLAMTMLAASPGLAAEMGDADDPIKLAMLEWTGAQISAQVAGQLLDEMGYEVEFVTAGNFPQFSGLSDGTLSASVEVWLNNVGDIFPKVMAAGDIKNIGALGLETKESWVYPKFMEEVCPGLPDWTALTKPDCVAALMTPETAPNARFLDYPSDWGSRAATILDDNDMPYTAVPSGSEGALVAELKSAEAAETPLIMMFWAPHWALAETDVGWVDMPPCKEQTNAHCITPPDVAKIVWSGFGDKWPAALAFLQAFQMDTEDQQKMMLRIDNKGEDLDAVAADWIENNKDVWQPWVEAAQG